MREIKFRAWTGNRMIRPDRIINGGGCTWTEDSIPNFSEALMQYTGLKDKNGKKIFEGDVIRYNYHVDINGKPSTDTIMAIEYHTKVLNIGWENDETLFVGFILRGNDNGKAWYTDIPTIEDIEVIGNIYENPELLNEKQE